MTYRERHPNMVGIAVATIAENFTVDAIHAALEEAYAQGHDDGVDDVRDDPSYHGLTSAERGG